MHLDGAGQSVIQKFVASCGQNVNRGMSWPAKNAKYAKENLRLTWWWKSRCDFPGRVSEDGSNGDRARPRAPPIRALAVGHCINKIVHGGIWNAFDVRR